MTTYVGRHRDRTLAARRRWMWEERNTLVVKAGEAAYTPRHGTRVLTW